MRIHLMRMTSLVLIFMTTLPLCFSMTSTSSPTLQSLSLDYTTTSTSNTTLEFTISYAITHISSIFSSNIVGQVVLLPTTDQIILVDYIQGMDNADVYTVQGLSCVITSYRPTTKTTSCRGSIALTLPVDVMSRDMKGTSWYLDVIPSNYFSYETKDAIVYHYFGSGRPEPPALRGDMDALNIPSDTPSKFRLPFLPWSNHIENDTEYTYVGIGQATYVGGSDMMNVTVDAQGIITLDPTNNGTPLPVGQYALMLRIGNLTSTSLYEAYIAINISSPCTICNKPPISMGMTYASSQQWNVTGNQAHTIIITASDPNNNPIMMYPSSVWPSIQGLTFNRMTPSMTSISTCVMLSYTYTITHNGVMGTLQSDKQISCYDIVTQIQSGITSYNISYTPPKTTSWDGSTVGKTYPLCVQIMDQSGYPSLTPICYGITWSATCPLINTNAIVTYNDQSRKQGTNASFICNVGGVSGGPSSVICLGNGVWDAPIPLCADPAIPYVRPTPHPSLPTSAPTTPVPIDNSSTSSTSSFNPYIIVAVIVGSILILLIIFLIVAYYRHCYPSHITVHQQSPRKQTLTKKHHTKNFDTTRVPSQDTIHSASSRVIPVNIEDEEEPGEPVVQPGLEMVKPSHITRGSQDMTRHSHESIPTRVSHESLPPITHRGSIQTQHTPIPLQQQYSYTPSQQPVPLSPQQSYSSRTPIPLTLQHSYSSSQAPIPLAQLPSYTPSQAPIPLSPLQSYTPSQAPIPLSPLQSYTPSKATQRYSYSHPAVPYDKRHSYSHPQAPTPLSHRSSYSHHPLIPLPLQHEEGKMNLQEGLQFDKPPVSRPQSTSVSQVSSIDEDDGEYPYDLDTNMHTRGSTDGIGEEGVILSIGAPIPLVVLSSLHEHDMPQPDQDIPQHDMPQHEHMERANTNDELEKQPNVYLGL